MHTAPFAAPNPSFAPAALVRRLLGGARAEAPPRRRTPAAAYARAEVRAQPAPAIDDLAQRVRESGEW